ncbi:D-2-hydroxyacid dehydrogenase [Rufibacter latericius]|uniref:D-2-hydroxyacid dehydrogenase n=1 Tax=Rufibacter latericius TaxID=2487040 RepID=A0A3M9MYR6_9BACT|nr:D-2-hydroxyacid dehydrogenase [Rufibacter latericius]RNI30692.1 D-2-hydroxyacid dehydrogenase [Rufibacter latericius]
MQLFIYSDLDSQGQRYLEENLPQGVIPYFSNGSSEEENKGAFTQTEVIFGNPPSSWFSLDNSALKFWQLDSAGFDQYQQLQVNAIVSNMGDFFAEACAETMVAGILAFYRGLPELMRIQQKSEWKGKAVRFTLERLGQKSAIVLGAGTIGKAVKRMLEGFGTEVKMMARTNPAAHIHSSEELFQLLPLTDLVINTLPGNLDRYVSAEFLEQMKKGSLYANVGRGNTTDEEALIAALKSGHLAGAVLDVTQVEPLPKESPLWGLENVILTQHTGGGQAQETQGKIDRFLSNLQHYISGQQVADQITLGQGY